MNIALWLIALSIIILAGVVALWMFPRPRLTLALLLLLLPFHTGIFQVARVELNLSPSVALALQSWKEGLLLLLAACLIARALSAQKINIAHPEMVVLVGLFVAAGAQALVRAPDLVTGLYDLRGTFEPFVVLLLALALPLNMDWYKRIVPKLLGVGVLVALFAIFQALFLGYPFLWKYYAVNSALSPSFGFMNSAVQRAMGTFASPNQLSLYLVFLIIVAFNLVLRFPRHHFWMVAAIGLLFVTLLLTVSRSGWLALVAGLGFSFLIWRRKQWVIMGGAVLTLIAAPVATAFGLDSHVMATVTGREISANYHADIFRQNVQIMLDNPLGVGPGRVGARALRFDNNPASNDYVLTESYLLQLGMGLGIPALALFLLIMAYSGAVTFGNIYRLSDKWSRALAVSAVAALLAALVHAVFIPDLQDLTVSSYLWLLVGLGMRLPALERQEQRERARV